MSEAVDLLVFRNDCTQAQSRSAVGQGLRGESKKYFPFGKTSRKSNGVSLLDLRPRIPLRELSLFCRQLAVMIDAGIPLLTGLMILRDQGKKNRFRVTLTEIIEQLEGGQSFCQSLARYPNTFPRIFTAMVEAGEAGGFLGTSLEQIAVFWEWEHRLREKVKSSIAYPVFVLVITIIALNFLVLYVLPAFSAILEQMDVELPRVTRFVLDLSNFWHHYWFLFVVILGGALVSAVCLIKFTPEGRRGFDRFILKVPLFGEIVRKTIISRFCRTLAALLRVGVPVIAALEVVEKTCGNMVVERSIAKARDAICQGESMAVPLRRSGIFPLLVIEMISVGEETGALDAMLEKAGDFYDEDLENLALRLAALTEPVLLLFVGGIVCLVLLSVFLPLFEIVGNVN